MFEKMIDLGFLVYVLPYIDDEELVSNIGRAVVKFADENMSEGIAYENTKKLSAIKRYKNKANTNLRHLKHLNKVEISNLWQEVTSGKTSAFEVGLTLKDLDFQSFLQNKINYSAISKQKLLAGYIKKIYNLISSEDIISLMTGLSQPDEDGGPKQVEPVKMHAAAFLIECYIEVITSLRVLNWKEKLNFLELTLDSIPKSILTQELYYKGHHFLSGLASIVLDNEKKLSTLEAKNKETKELHHSIGNLINQIDKSNQIYSTQFRNYQEDVDKNLGADNRKLLKDWEREKLEFIKKQKAHREAYQSKVHAVSIFVEFAPILAFLGKTCITSGKLEFMYMASATVFLASNTGICVGLSNIYSASESLKYPTLVMLFALINGIKHDFVLTKYSRAEAGIIFIAPIIMLICSSASSGVMSDKYEAQVKENNEAMSKRRSECNKKIEKNVNKRNVYMEETDLSLRRESDGLLAEHKDAQQKYQALVLQQSELLKEYESGELKSGLNKKDVLESLLKSSIWVDKTEYYNSRQIVVYDEREFNLEAACKPWFEASVTTSSLTTSNLTTPIVSVNVIEVYYNILIKEQVRDLVWQSKSTRWSAYVNTEDKDNPEDEKANLLRS